MTRMYLCVDHPMVLIVYGVSGSGKRSCCNFLAAESHVTLQDIDIFDASTYSLPTQHYQSSGSFHYNPFSRENSHQRSDDLASALFSTHTSRSVSSLFAHIVHNTRSVSSFVLLIHDALDYGGRGVIAHALSRVVSRSREHRLVFNRTTATPTPTTTTAADHRSVLRDRRAIFVLWARAFPWRSAQRVAGAAAGPARAAAAAAELQCAARGRLAGRAAGAARGRAQQQTTASTASSRVRLLAVHDAQQAAQNTAADSRYVSLFSFVLCVCFDCVLVY